jgi:hypothetical protein
MTYRLEENDDGFVVHYLNAKGVCVWSEFYADRADVWTAYGDEIGAGQFIF